MNPVNLLVITFEVTTWSDTITLRGASHPGCVTSKHLSLYLHYEASFQTIAGVIICMNWLLLNCRSSAETTPSFVLVEYVQICSWKNLMQRQKLGVCSQVISCLCNSSATCPPPGTWNMNEIHREGNNRAGGFAGGLFKVTVVLNGM